MSAARRNPDPSDCHSSNDFVDCRRVLIVATKTLLTTWIKELEVCDLGHLTYEFKGSAGERCAW